MLQSYRELLVWQKAMELALLVYRLTETFPKRETYGLAAQLRRAGVSIPSNIAEGYGRASRGEYLQFLSIAQGSLKELETQILLSRAPDIPNGGPSVESSIRSRGDREDAW